MALLPRWLRVPDQEIESLSRCRECGSVVRETEASLRRHVGHHLVPLVGLHVNELVRVKLGWL